MPDVRLRLIHGDMADGSSLKRILADAQPHEIYNLAAQSNVKVAYGPQSAPTYALLA